MDSVYFSQIPAPKGVPQRSKKWDGKGIKREPKTKAFSGVEKLQNPLLPCVYAQNGPPKGAQNEPETEPKPGPEWSPKWWGNERNLGNY